MAVFDAISPLRVPIKIQRTGARRIDIKEIQRLIDTDKEVKKNLNSNGVYIFSLRAGKGSKPWYVGKSERSTFLKKHSTLAIKQ